MNKAIKVALLSLLAASAACSDSAVAPPSQPSRAITATGGGASASLSGWDTLRFSFVIDPSRNVSYPLGLGNSITFPAGSLCDPLTSSYGPGTWDQPCTVASGPLTVYAKAWLDASGDPRIDFTPSIRFVPTLNPAGWVTLSFTDHSAALNPLSAILYCRTVSSACVDESLTDPTLTTVKDPVAGKLTRRVKHFSGYNVAAGGDCSVTADDPTCSGSVGMSMSMNVIGTGPGLGGGSKPSGSKPGSGHE
jgi:hypothetical protein